MPCLDPTPRFDFPSHFFPSHFFPSCTRMTPHAYILSPRPDPTARPWSRRVCPTRSDYPNRSWATPFDRPRPLSPHLPTRLPEPSRNSSLPTTRATAELFESHRQPLPCRNDPNRADSPAPPTPFPSPSAPTPHATPNHVRSTRSDHPRQAPSPPANRLPASTQQRADPVRQPMPSPYGPPLTDFPVRPHPAQICPDRQPAPRRPDPARQSSTTNNERNRNACVRRSAIRRFPLQI